MSAARPRAILCVAGGIAAYKAPALVRALVKEGFEVRVLLTDAARAFVSELALASVSGHPVRIRLLDASEEGTIGHIDLADWADLIIVAPGTANLMARAAHGLADDLVSCVLLATLAPVLWAPAMNTNMWRHPATQENLATLRSRGAHVIGPGSGDLACGWVGEGRMSDPPEIAAQARRLLQRRSLWSGRRVLVSAGPTRTFIDPVRFVANASTGAMGFAIAEAAAELGADVTLVAGPVDRPTPRGVTRVDVETAAEMHTALSEGLAAAPVDLVAMVAAVGDLEFDGASEKLPKTDLLARLGSATWRQGVDILASLTAAAGPQTRFLGFAAQTVDGDGAEAEAQLVRLGEAKLASKGADAVFVNRVGVPGLGFASATNGGTLILSEKIAGEGPRLRASGPPIPKPALARWLLGQLDVVLWPGADRDG